MTDLETASNRDAPSFLPMLYIGTGTPLRLHGGFGDRQLPADDILDPSGIYVGRGLITSLPDIRQTTGGVAEQLQITFSGAAPALKTLVNNPGLILKRRVNLGLMFLDEDLQQAAPVAWFWRGNVDTVTDTWDGGQASVALTVTSGRAGRKRALLKYFTDASHRVDHPTDDFFQFVYRYSVAYNPRWPG